MAFLIFLSVKKDKTTQKRKFSLCRFLIILGAVLIVIALAELVYEKRGVLIVGIILAGLGIFCMIIRGKNFKKKGNLSKIFNPNIPDIKLPPTLSNSKFQSEVANKQRKQRERSYRELLKKYEEYSKAINEIQRRNKGQIPSRGTKEGDLRHRYIQAMQAIENMARKQGFSMPKESARLEKQGKRSQKQQQKQLQVSLKHLINQYNQIQRENPNDPRLYQIAAYIKELRKQKR